MGLSSSNPTSYLNQEKLKRKYDPKKSGIDYEMNNKMSVKKTFIEK